MAVFYIILGNDAVIFDPLFRKEINRICFLQKGITDVFFILQYLFQCFWSPFGFACRC